MTSIMYELQTLSESEIFQVENQPNLIMIVSHPNFGHYFIVYYLLMDF